ncbi:peptidoglycan/LPS O-acetylase OafA/YrhL [Buttiauxella sp. BIGb0552]|uniref:acyltransferase family protein n=1 Tax=Buttiauxella sp. BIGb0552 TaxID=2485120 RepID=UPI0010671105|nr:acyltransferase family protein [Buttiauxella sp. BIGb0552]TDX14665.1 peptidoglycan/LPS O-acetylase OafA/YrhL [Buttiauxella sp. BIGb0552]
MTYKKFREDINGLRALAVMSVLIFHFNPSFLPGGFAGVDVFFVISGFLMTSIIFNGISSGSFSIKKFIIRRCERIVPALLVLIFLIVVIGYVAFEPLTYQLVGKHGLASLLFTSNILYNSESGYFDPASHSKLLLHTWSLSVEWQFYILYPIAIYFLSKYLSLQKVKILIVICFILSFAYCVFETQRDSQSTYFMLQFRAWEMLAGGMAFLYQINANKTKRFIFEFIGISLILFSFFYFSNLDPWPGYYALIPVFGAYLCMLSNNNNSILSGYILQKIGLWSYSIYLIHWPIIVISKKLDIHINFQIYLVFVIVLSILLHHLIERKRNYSYKSAFVYLAILLISYSISINGLNWRVDEFSRTTKDKLIERFYGGYNTFNKANGNIYFNRIGDDVGLILSGDSYSQQYMDFWTNKNTRIVSVSYVMCMILPDYTSSNTIECNSMFDKLKNVFDEYKSAPVIINQNWETYINNLKRKDNGESVTTDDYYKVIEEQLVKLIKTGGDERKYYFVGTYNYPDYDVIGCVSSEGLLINKFSSKCRKDVGRTISVADEMLLRIAKQNKNVSFISPKDALCSKEKCSIIIDGNPVLFDGVHLSRYGANVVGSYIEKNIH